MFPSFLLSGKTGHERDYFKYYPKYRTVKRSEFDRTYVGVETYIVRYDLLQNTLIYTKHANNNKDLNSNIKLRNSKFVSIANQVLGVLNQSSCLARPKRICRNQQLILK